MLFRIGYKILGKEITKMFVYMCYVENAFVEGNFNLMNWKPFTVMTCYVEPFLQPLFDWLF